MRFFRLLAITVLLLACVVLGSACTGAKGETGAQGERGIQGTQGPQGEQGIQGIQGPRGDTGAQGPQGIQGNQGEKGDPGMPGAGVTWWGGWNGTMTYNLNDAVGYQGSSYISKVDGNTGILPTDPGVWDLWVEKGETGPEGPQGIEGPQGEPGADGAQGPQGEPGPNMIVAMGVIASDGQILQGYNVAGCTWDGTGKRYFVELTGIAFELYDYVVLVTPTAYGPAFFTYSYYEDYLAVMFEDDQMQGVATTFSFMVLECP